MSVLDLFRIDELKAKIERLEMEIHHLNTELAKKNAFIEGLMICVENQEFQAARKAVENGGFPHRATDNEVSEAEVRELIRKQLESVAQHGTTIEEQFDYKIASAGVEIVRYIGTDSVVTIPETIQQRKVFRIGKRVFYHYDALEKVMLPQHIKEIGEEAFAYSGIKEINLPMGLQSIEENAFESTKNLKRIQIPGSVQKITHRAFHLSGLEALVIEEGCEEIGRHAFDGCPIRQIVLPKTLKAIGENNFRSVKATHLVFPDSLWELGKGNCAAQHIAFLNDDTELHYGFDYCSDSIIYCNLGSNAHIEAREKGLQFKPLSEFPCDVEDVIEETESILTGACNDVDDMSETTGHTCFETLDASTWNPESVLRQEGYTVSQKEGLSDYRRQYILRRAIEAGKITKWQAIEHIELQIMLRRGNPIYNMAIAKWERDLSFLNQL